VYQARQGASISSEVITEAFTDERAAALPVPPHSVGLSFYLLIRNLDGARVVIPDRPHRFEELQSVEDLARIQRRKSFEVYTNSLGMRGEELESPKKRFRILCVGDSHTFGWGVTEEETYPARLAEELGVEVINGGVPAMKPDDVAQWVDAHAPTIQPDLLLFGIRPPPSQVNWDPYLSALRSMAGAVDPAPVGVVLPPVSTFDYDPRIQIREGELLAQRVPGVPVLELTTPFLQAQTEGAVMEPWGSGYRLIELPSRRVIVEASAEPGGTPRAIAQAFESEPDLEASLFFDGSHVDAKGYRIWATEVARWIRGQGWL
jgi:lysophospholipase L1-like esterase